jgi:ABC-type glycerol-3-phosphate transport system substrate-binding protein
MECLSEPVPEGTKSLRSRRLRWWLGILRFAVHFYLFAFDFSLSRELAMRKVLHTLALWILMATAAGCQAAGDAPEVGEPSISPTPIVEPTGVPETPPDGTPTLTPPPAGGNVLVVWTAPSHAPSLEIPGGQVLLDQLAAFDETHPDLQVEMLVKAPSGRGGTLAYLRSAPAVAPGILPDLVLLDRDTLVQAASEDLLVPLGGLIDPTLLESLYPAAVDLGTVEGQLVGIAYTLQTQHVAYRETLFTDPPRSFTDLLESPVPFVFPVGTLGYVSRTILTQYMAAGGRLVDGGGQPVIDVDALTGVLTLVDDAHEAGVIDPVLFQMTDPDDSWVQYTGRLAALAVVTSTRYLAEQDAVRSTGLSWIPTPDGQPYALVNGWMWAITTRDPDRQAAALALLGSLMAPINQGAYAQAAGWLPSQPAALVVWGDDNRYAVFASSLLPAADMLPDADQQAASGAAIQDALENVLLNGVSPIQAANQAAQQVSGGDDDS